MAASSEFRDFIADLLAGMGEVHVRSMFGGAGIFLEGVMFGLIADDELYLRVDDRTAPLFVAEGMPAFTYSTSRNRRIVMPYRAVPHRLLDDRDELAEWAQRAFDAAWRSRKTSGRKR